jgi:hypothetical protein
MGARRGQNHPDKPLEGHLQRLEVKLQRREAHLLRLEVNPVPLEAKLQGLHGTLKGQEVASSRTGGRGNGGRRPPGASRDVGKAGGAPPTAPPCASGAGVHLQQLRRAPRALEVRLPERWRALREGKVHRADLRRVPKGGHVHLCRREHPVSVQVRTSPDDSARCNRSPHLEWSSASDCTRNTSRHKSGFTKTEKNEQEKSFCSLLSPPARHFTRI